MTYETESPEFNEDAVFEQAVSELEGSPSETKTIEQPSVIPEELPAPDKEVPTDGEGQPPKWMEGLPEEARAEFENLQSDNQRLEQSVTSHKGRYKASEAKLTKIQEQLKQLEESGADLSDAALLDEGFAAEFPELAEAVSKSLGKSQNAVQKQMSSMADSLKTLVNSEVDEINSIKAEEAEDAVRQAVPDANQLLAGPAFNNWLSAQAPGVQEMANSEDPANAIYVLNQFKAQSPDNAIKQRRSSQLSAMSSLPSGRGGGRTVEPNADDEDALFDAIVREQER